MSELKPIFHDLDFEFNTYHKELLRVNKIEKAKEALNKALLKEIKNGRDVSDDDAILEFAENKGVVRVYNSDVTFGSDSIKEIREKMGLSQSQFAKEFNFNVRTLQDWECGRTRTPKYVITLLNKVKKVGDTI
jgi:putative transcriptional regulator